MSVLKDYLGRQHWFLFVGFAVILALVSLYSCGNEREDADNRPSEGVLNYKISYPVLEKTGNMMIIGLPKTMRLTYRGNVYRTDIEQKMLRFKTSLIADCDNHTLMALFSLKDKKYYSQMSKAEVEEYLKQFPEVFYMAEPRKDTLLNMECKTTLALFDNISNEITIKYTSHIPVEDPNWCNPYKDIDDMLLSYGLQYHGVSMLFKANEFSEEAVNENFTQVPDEYKKVPYKVIDEEIEKLFSMVKTR